MSLEHYVLCTECKCRCNEVLFDSHGYFSIEGAVFIMRHSSCGEGNILILDEHRDVYKKEGEIDNYLRARNLLHLLKANQEFDFLKKAVRWFLRPLKPGEIDLRCKTKEEIIDDIGEECFNEIIEEMIDGK